MLKPLSICGILGIALGLMLNMPSSVRAEEAQYLEVADFDQLMALTPDAREKYVGHMRDLLVELAEGDAGTDAEVFGGNSSHASNSVPSWKGGYLAIMNAFEEPAHAFGSNAGPTVKAAQDKAKADAEKAATDAAAKNKLPAAQGDKGKTDCPDGYVQYFEMCRNGIVQEQDCYASGGILIVRGPNSAFSNVNNTMCVPPDYYKNDGNKNKKWHAYDEAKAQAELKRRDEKKKETAALDQKLCPGKKPDCAARPKKSSPQYSKMKQDFIKARKGCIMGGNVSAYNSSGSEVTEADVKPGNCKNVTKLTFGDMTVKCEKENDPNITLCNPMFFDIEKPVDKKSAVGRCVPKSGHETADCSKAYKAAEKEFAKGDPNMLAPKQHFWDMKFNGAQEAHKQAAAMLNETCQNDYIRAFTCSACGVIQDHLKRDNKLLKNCGKDDGKGKGNKPNSNAPVSI